MKKLFTSLALVITLITFAQAPQGFNYQATVRNSAGALIVNQNVNFKFNIMLNSASSLPVFSETHFTPTDDLGQVNLVIGQGTANVGTFSSINWANGSYYLGIELNTGSGYIAMGTTQLLSVPYALYANSSGNSNFNFPNGTNIGDTLNWIWNGTAWVPTSTTSSTQLPVIATVIATNTLTSSPSSGGTITSDGGYSITSKGVCWSTSPNPTISNNITNDGTGASNFTSLLSNLTPTTLYYYRAYATNSNGTSYGNAYTFTTIAVPQITTTSISTITSSTASSGGAISGNGGAYVSEKGVCWSTSPNPTIALTTKTTQGTGNATFTSSITGLLPVTTYYVRAYATNFFGTAYGQEEVFTSLATLPTLTTTEASAITSSTASSGGTITNDVGGLILSRGVVWSNNNNPSITSNTGITNDGSSIGVFSSNITGLYPFTNYYLRAYATNSAGTSYGNEISFITSQTTIPTFPLGTVHCNPNSPTAIIDVINPITGKTWMDRNLGASQVATSSTDALAYGDLYQWGRRADGHQCRNSTTITTLSSSNQPPNGNFILSPNTPIDWITPQNDNLWQGVSGINNPCPSGYRLPTVSELLDERNSWATNTDNPTAAFNSPLKLTMAGSRNYDGIIYVSAVRYSSSNISTTTFGRVRSLQIADVGAIGIINTTTRAQGNSVRCIKN
jgi:hypothetical protein